jgi:Chemotaxis signal transduction protein
MTQETEIENINENQDVDIDENNMNQYLTFKIENEEYGINLKKIREIKGWNETTRLPNSPNYTKGVINLRGAVIPVYDLKNKFQIGETKTTEKHVVIMVNIADRLVGILVDSVSDIVNANESEIKSAPHIKNKINDEYVNGLLGIENKMIVILNVETLFAPKKEVNDANANLETIIN